MANFCGTCGSPRGGGKFCPSCGLPYDAETGIPAAPSAPSAPSAQEPTPPTSADVPAAPETAPVPPAPMMSAAPMPAAPPTGWQPAATQATWHDQSATAAPRAPRQPMQLVNPFREVPFSDYVRDAGAVFLLFASLGVIWDWGDSSALPNQGGDHWWVVLSALLSVASLAVPYVVKAGVSGALGAMESRLIKLALNIPVAVCVLVALINELVALDTYYEGGIGVAVGLLLAGGLLAAQPRRIELPGENDGETWVGVGLALAGLAVGVGVLTYVLHLVDDVTSDGLLFESPLLMATEVLSAPVLLLVVIGWPFLQLLSGGQAWRRVFVTSGFGVLGGALLSQANDQESFVFVMPAEKWSSPTGGTFLVGAAAAVVGGHALARRSVRRDATHPAEQWVRTASAALLVAAVALVVSGGVVVLIAVALEDVTAGAVVIAVMLVACAGLLGACVPMIADPRTSRPLALALIGGELVLAVVVVSVIRAQDVVASVVFPSASDFPAFLSAVPAYTFAALFVLPVLAMFALTLPEPVRAALGPVLHHRPAHQGAQHAPHHAPPQTAHPGYYQQPASQPGPAPSAGPYQPPSS